MSVAINFLFERLVTLLAAMFLTLALVVMGVQIVFRYGFNDSLFWAEEVARYALVWSSMTGAAVAYRQGGHVAVTAIVNRLPTSVRRLIFQGVHLLIFAFSVILVWQGWTLTMRNFDRHQISTALEIEIAWIYLSIPVAGALIMLAALEAVYRGTPVSTGATAI